jgi:prohibitin 2
MVLGLVLALAAGALLSSVTVINAGTRGVTKTFGEITAVKDEGLHFRTPFITQVTTVDIRTQRHESASSAASRDLQVVSTQVVLNYRPDPAQVENLLRTIGPNYVPVVVEPALQEALKAATAQFTAEELITQRPLVSEQIRAALEERLTPRGIIVEDLSITEFAFSEEFRAAIEAKQVAEQNALRAEQELRRAQIEAQQQVARAEAEAEARLSIAQAEAEALRLQREVVSPELLQLRFIERWNGNLPQFMAGDETNLMPMIAPGAFAPVAADAAAAPAAAAPAASGEAAAPAAPAPAAPATPEASATRAGRVPLCPRSWQPGAAMEIDPRRPTPRSYTRRDMMVGPLAVLVTIGACFLLPLLLRGCGAAAGG